MRRAKNTPYTPQDDAIIDEMLQQGASVDDIAARLGRSREGLMNRLRVAKHPLYHPRTPSPEVAAEMTRLYPATRTADIAARFGYSPATVRRIAKAAGAVKSPAFITKCNAERLKGQHAAAKAKGETFGRQYQKGRAPHADFSPERKAEAARKRGESLKALFQAERRRAKFGLPQRTRLNISSQTSRKCAYRWWLRHVGYLEDATDHNVYYYTADSMRIPASERTAAKYHIKFKPLTPDCRVKEFRATNRRAERV